METKPKKTIAPRVDMPCQPADVRAHNFDEVATGYTKEMAMQEASRCLQCKKPLCMKGCPVEVPIRDFIAEVARGNFDAAYRIIKTTNSLPAGTPVRRQVHPQRQGPAHRHRPPGTLRGRYLHRHQRL